MDLNPGLLYGRSDYFTVGGDVIPLARAKGQGALTLEDLRHSTSIQGAARKRAPLFFEREGQQASSTPRLQPSPSTGSLSGRIQTLSEPRNALAP